MSRAGQQEVEIRYEISAEQAANLRERPQLGAPTRREEQYDLYFDTPNHDWSGKDPIFKWLRLRRVAEAAQLNMKIFEYDEHGNTVGNTEYETEVSDFETARAVLLNSGLVELVTVHKTRLTWIVDGTQICLDTVADLGHFVEIESVQQGGNYLKVQSRLIEVANRLGIDGAVPDSRGYPYNLIRRREGRG